MFRARKHVNDENALNDEKPTQVTQYPNFKRDASGLANVKFAT